MSYWSTISLKAALLRLLAMTFLLVMVLAGLGIAIYEARTYQQRVEAQVNGQLEVVALNLQAALDFDDRESALETLRTLALDPRFVAAFVYRENGELFARFVTPLGDALEVKDNVANESTDAARLLRVATPVQYDGEVTATIHSVYRLSQLTDRLPQYFIVLGVLIVALGVMTALQYLAVEKLIAKPARELASIARVMSRRSSEDTRLPENEIQQLRVDFEQMLDALTERESRLQSQQDRMQLALKAAQQGVWELNPASGAMVWDSAMFEITGLSEEHFSPSWFGLLQLVREEDAELLEASRNRLLSEGRTEKAVFRWSHREKGERHLEVVGRLYAAETGSPGVIRGVIRDVTDTVNSERALRESELQFRRLIMQSPVAMSVIDIAADISLVNDAFIKLFGYARAELTNVAVWWPLAYPDPDYRAHVIAEWLKRLESMERTGNPFVPMEVSVRCNDGEYRYVEFTAQQIGERTLVIALDLTQRKRAEEQVTRLNEQLEQRVRDRTQELEIANRELEGFSYSVSHDLRAPLRAISGFGAALNQEYRNKLDADGQGYLDRMLIASQRMGQLIDDLLRFSRLSRTDMLQEPIDMTELAKQAWADLQDISEESLGPLQMMELPSACGDRGLVKQVLVNLLANAVKFSRHRQPREVVVFTERIDGETIYGVRDNGVGFNMAYVDKLFGVFHRLHRAEEFEGTGVGLALCRRIVERHGGRIWAESEPNEGATFRFTLSAANSTKV